MSTDMFSSDKTLLLIEPILRFFAPSISPKQLQTAHFIIRKMAHVSEYFIFGILCFHAVSNGVAESKMWRCVFWTVLIVIIFASVDEFHQSLVVTRTSSVRDISIDTFGGIVGVGLSVLRFRSQMRTKLNPDVSEA
jgi:VanZ family protein